MVAVLAFETVSPIEAHTATISFIIFARLFLDLETMPASSAYNIPQIGCGSATFSWGLSRPFSGLPRFCPAPFLILLFGAHHILYHICIGVKALHRRTQYGSKENVEQ